MQQRGGLGELEETAGGCPTPGAPSSPAAFSRLPVVETLLPPSDCEARSPRRSRGGHAAIKEETPPRDKLMEKDCP